MKIVNRVNTAGQASESREQQALFRWWDMYRSQYPAALMFAVPNGGARSAITGARLKAEGVLAGVPDVFLAFPAGGLHGLFIEMKRAKGGATSTAQKIVGELLSRAGYGVAVCHGWQDARDTVIRYMEGSYGHERMD